MTLREVKRAFTVNRVGPTDLSIILNHAPHGILAFEAILGADDQVVDFACVFANDTAEAFFYQTPETLLEQRLRSGIGAALPAHRIQDYVHVYQSGQPLSYHYAADLPSFPHGVNVAITKTPTGLLVTLTPTPHIQTVTELDQIALLQTRLHESELLYQATTTTIKEGVMIHLRDGTIQFCNANAERMLGLTADQMMRRTSIDPLWHTLHEDGSPFPGETHPAMVALETGEPQDNVIMGVHKPDGSITWLSINAHPLIYTGETEPYAVVTTFDDVTEDKAQAEALKESEARFSSVFHNSPVPMVISTTDFDHPIYIEVNDAYAQLIGYTPKELLGQSLVNMGIALQDHDRTERRNQLAHKRNYSVVEARLRNRFGEVRDVLISAQRLIIGQNEYDVEVLLDITERKQLERQALALSLEKERVKLISRFIQETSHEFRTPLSIMHSSMYLLNRTEDPARRAEKSRVIEEQISRITTLVDMLTKMTQLDSGIGFDTLPVNVNQMLRDLAARHQPMFTEKQLSLSVNLADKLPMILTAAVHLEEALMQIIDNAVRYTPVGGDVTLSTDHDRDHVVITIADSGIGIPEKALPHIFERFYRVDKAHSTPGFGLGLSIAQSVVEKLGGSISVQSVEGQGTIFRVRLPINHTNTLF